MLWIFTGLDRASFAVSAVDGVHNGALMYNKAGLVVDSHPRYGFHFSDENFSIEDGEPLKLHPAIAQEITGISYKEGLSLEFIMLLGSGKFICDTGTVKISEEKKSGFEPYVEVGIIAKTVDDFNATVKALRNGELKKEGEELTAFEMLQKSMEVLSVSNKVTLEQLQDAENEKAVLEQRFGDIENRNEYLEAELESDRKKIKDLQEEREQLRKGLEDEKMLVWATAEERDQLREELEKSRAEVKKWKSFFDGVASIFDGKGKAPKTGNDTFDILIEEISNLKNRNLWQRIWNK